MSALMRPSPRPSRISLDFRGWLTRLCAPSAKMMDLPENPGFEAPPAVEVPDVREDKENDGACHELIRERLTDANLSLQVRSFPACRRRWSS